MPTSTISGSPAQRLQCLFGLLVFILLAYAIGRLYTLRAGGPRPRFPWRVVLWGVALQFVFAAIVLWLPGLLQRVNDVVNALLGFTRAGANMVFGNLADPDGAPVVGPDGKTVVGTAKLAAYFAFFILPTIVFFSMLTAILYHTGVMQAVVHALAWVMAKTMRTSGAETLSAAANIFVGQTEAPLMVRPFLMMATRSELMCVMVAGFANIASGVLGVYTAWLQPYVANAGGHLAAACFVSAPAALLVSKLLVPETGTPQTAEGVGNFRVARVDANLIDAATRGTSEGVSLAINVGAMLITFTALVALVNGFVGWASVATHAAPEASPLTLERIFGFVCAPFAWLAGVSWQDAPQVGSLLGVKTVLNELIAYSDMKDRFAADPAFISPRSALIATYALCGFANFASIGIQVGGIGLMAPDRRADLSRLGLLALLGGALASLMTAAVVGVLI
jgi:CNT family concentrative nucleoside transporter